MVWSEILKGIDKQTLTKAYEGYKEVSKDKDFKDAEFESAYDLYKDKEERQEVIGSN